MKGAIRREMKREADYGILARLEEGQDGMKTEVALLTQSVNSIDKAINKDNGVKCYATRMRDVETFMIQSKLLAWIVPAVISGISCLLGTIVAVRIILGVK